MCCGKFSLPACRPAASRSAGWTLLELIVTLALVSVLLGIAVFGMRQWETALQSRTMARQIASMLRGCRSEAVSSMREARVKFMAEGEGAGAPPVCWIQQGNLSNASTLWQDLQGSRLEFPRGQAMGFSTSCQSSAAPKYLSFNPDGSSNALYICIQEAPAHQPLVNKYAVGVSHASTGRVVVLRWNPISSRFE